MKWLDRVGSMDGGFNQSDNESREEHLLFAILARAMIDYCAQSADILSHHKRDADRWFFCGDKQEWSFLWVCANLELCPQKIRRIIYYEDKAVLSDYLRNFRFKKLYQTQGYRGSAYRPAP